MLSNCSTVGCTAPDVGAAATVVVPLAGTCGAGALFTSRPSFSMRRCSRGGGIGTCTAEGAKGADGGATTTEPFIYQTKIVMIKDFEPDLIFFMNRMNIYIDIDKTQKE